MTSQATLPERLHTHNTTISICLLRCHQLCNNSLNSVILKYFQCFALAFSHAPVLPFSWSQGTSQNPHFSLGYIFFCEKLPANFLPRKPGRTETRRSTTKSLWPLCSGELRRKEYLSICCICMCSVCTEQGLDKRSIHPRALLRRGENLGQKYLRN